MAGHWDGKNRKDLEEEGRERGTEQREETGRGDCNSDDCDTQL